MYRYIAVVHKDPDSDYGISFPDFPGCITAGHTIEEAGDMAYEALSFHIRGICEDGEEIPSPSAFEDISSDPEHTDAVAFLSVSLPDPELGFTGIRTYPDASEGHPCQTQSLQFSASVPKF